MKILNTNNILGWNVKKINYLVYYLYTIVLAAIIDIILWSFLFMANTLIHLLWVGFEANDALLLGAEHMIIVVFAFTIIGSLLIAKFEKIMEFIPKNQLM